MTDKRKRFQELYPNSFFLTVEEPEALLTFMKANAWIDEQEQLLVLEKPGEGNMNYVLRVKTDQQSLIVKQSRPWVEKYPQIDAPIERIIVEAQFYDVLSEVQSLRPFIPALKGFKAESFIMVVEDLGQASDFTAIYSKTNLPDISALHELTGFLSDLHQVSPEEFQEPFPANQSLKTLNAEHIFNYPYMPDNGFDLDTVQPGLGELARNYKNHESLKRAVEELSAVYLGQGTVLIHGDYYPGSWLQTMNGTRIIDPEFAYLGRAEFDLGVMVAHLKMARVDLTLIQQILSAYLPKDRLDRQLLAGFCGAEIIRRLIGLAQLPLDLSLSEKAELLVWAAEAVLNPGSVHLFQPAIGLKSSIPE
ncbi:phosphotransferase [Arundinibacter roseus]|uniref:Aminoglycoside phosphotransferase n=1 Tax=Arundinibacter roseus TaxID=2070510 RepID=A0A4R4KEU3_9BACT|nr:phosphotransferase [Arundinibacter roseus]TDB65356.1 aminoglycoside phosphotransferase [Arundinibacter roseus]